MGALSGAALAAGGYVHGITHQKFITHTKTGIDLEQASSQGIRLDIVTGNDLSERKLRLIDAGHCLVCLPGGTGTFDELWMAIGMVATHFRKLPIVVINVDGYYDGTIAQLERAERDGLLRQPAREYVTFVRTPAEAVDFCLASVEACHTLSVEGLDDEPRRRAVTATLEALPSVLSSKMDVASGTVLVSGLVRVPSFLKALGDAGVRAQWQGSRPLVPAKSEPPPRFAPNFVRGVVVGIGLSVGAVVSALAVLALVAGRKARV
jgi:predicted Rossmann-fold nucleotide-binding protein